MQQIQDHLNYLSTFIRHPEGYAADRFQAISGLPAFLRALLVADGTVTLLLRAYFNEAIVVQTIEQDSFLMPAPLPSLGLGEGEQAFFRRVKLVGGDSSRVYASAASVLNPSALQPDLFAALINENAGMGDVLRNAARGSYREILDIRLPGDTEVARTYAVILDTRPAILITETFNRAAFNN